VSYRAFAFSEPRDGVRVRTRLTRCRRRGLFVTRFLACGGGLNNETDARDRHQPSALHQINPAPAPIGNHRQHDTHARDDRCEQGNLQLYVSANGCITSHTGWDRPNRRLKPTSFQNIEANDEIQAPAPNAAT